MVIDSELDRKDHSSIIRNYDQNGAGTTIKIMLEPLDTKLTPELN
jgi:hypothetical protein